MHAHSHEPEFIRRLLPQNLSSSEAGYEGNQFSNEPTCRATCASSNVENNLDNPASIRIPTALPQPILSLLARIHRLLSIGLGDGGDICPRGGHALFTGGDPMKQNTSSCHHLLPPPTELQCNRQG